MLEFIAEHFSDCIYLAVFLVAMIPAIESKIAIPFALSIQIWGSATLSPFMAGLIAFCGSMIPSILVIWFSRKIKNKTSGFVHDVFVSGIQEKYKKNFSKLSAKNSVFKKCVMLSTFVAVPLPLTGVYTGSIIAGFTNLKFWHSFVSIFVGELVSCIIVVLLSTIFENSAFYLLMFSIAVLFLYLLIDIFILFINFLKHKNSKN